jgi:hypothetical protein
MSLAEEIAALQARANAEAQALVDKDKAAKAQENLTGGKLDDVAVANKFEDVQNAINASAPHAVIAHLLDLIKHLFAVVHANNAPAYDPHPAVAYTDPPNT